MEGSHKTRATSKSKVIILNQMEGSIMTEKYSINAGLGLNLKKLV